MEGAAPGPGALEDNLMPAAEHTRSHGRLTWRLHDRLPDSEWAFRSNDQSCSGEDLRGLAIAMRTFLEFEPLQ